jgi:hypothetical protein
MSPRQTSDKAPACVFLSEPRFTVQGSLAWLNGSNANVAVTAQSIHQPPWQYLRALAGNNAHFDPPSSPVICSLVV